MKFPWDIHPEIQRDRLLFVGHLLRAIRHEALETHEVAKGESNWSLGCRVLERTNFALVQSQSPDRPWFSILEAGRHFVFSIGGVPFRVYRGVAQPTKRSSLKRNHEEIHAQQLAFGFMTEPTDDVNWVWRIAVETDESGHVIRMTAFQALCLEADPDVADRVRNQWVIPLDEAISQGSNVTALRRDPVELPPPAVRRKPRKGRKSGTDGEGT